MNAPAEPHLASCALCRPDAAENLIWADSEWRIVRVDDPEYPGFYRVIRNSHAAEFTDLNAAARARCLELVVAIETVLRDQLAPTKINLASLGNLVPHVHWHVVARFAWDRSFPNAIWGPPQREGSPTHLGGIRAALPLVDNEIRRHLNSPAPRQNSANQRR